MAVAASSAAAALAQCRPADAFPPGSIHHSSALRLRVLPSLRLAWLMAMCRFFEVSVNTAAAERAS